MPETLELPGIDTPSQPATPAAETPTTSASVEPTPVNNAPDAPPQPPAAATTPEPSGERDDEGEGTQPRGQRGRGVQRRLEEFRSRAERAEGELEAYRRMGVGQQQPQMRAPPQPPADPEPQADNYATFQQFIAEKAAWASRQETRRALAQRDQEIAIALYQQQEAQRAETQQRGLEQMHGVFGNSMVEASQRYPDYRDVIENSTVNVPPHLEAVIASSDAPGDVAYYLAKNEGVMTRLANMHPIQAAHQVARIANYMKSPNVVSNAPPPGRPQGTRGSAVYAYPENATPEQHLEWEKRMKARGK